MGKAAKITRGGNKKRVNPGRAEAKQKALGAKSHTTSAKEAADARNTLKKKAMAIAGELKSKAQQPYQGASTSVVRMAPRATSSAAKAPPSRPAPAQEKLLCCVTAVDARVIFHPELSRVTLQVWINALKCSYDLKQSACWFLHADLDPSVTLFLSLFPSSATATSASIEVR
eukprot:gene10162-7116_t